MCVFSFHPVKVVTTGEGGAVTTNSPELAERLRAFRNHGIVRPSDREPWFYDVATTGYNYRITDLQAALGVSQLGRLAEFVERRGMIAARYGELLGGAPVRFPPEPPVGVTHARHLYPVQVPAADRRRIFEGLRSRGIGVQVHYIPIYRHTVFRDLGVDPARFPAVEQAYAGLISLPIFPDLSDGNQNSVVDALLSLL
jgi:dTDP-4-amino-4,6-dideoxygalactose transaminase